MFFLRNGHSNQRLCLWTSWCIPWSLHHSSAWCLARSQVLMFLLHESICRKRHPPCHTTWGWILALSQYTKCMHNHTRILKTLTNTSPRLLYKDPRCPRIFAHMLNGAPLSTIILRKGWGLISVRVRLAEQSHWIWWPSWIKPFLRRLGLFSF